MIQPAAQPAPQREPRIQGVKFLNAWPPLYGLMLGRESEPLRMAPPSVLAKRLVARECDVALAPVATLTLREGFEVVPGICLGADGDVTSVLVVGHCPIEDMDTLLLDTASGTSVVLAQLVAAQLRGGRPLKLEPADYARMERDVSGRTGAVVIGDQALAVRGQYPYVLDLPGAWKAWTGLPFVFAAWIAQAGAVDEALTGTLQRSLAHGLASRHEIACMWAAQHGGDARDYERYLTVNMKYLLEPPFEAGLREFLGRATSAGLLAPTTLRFARG